MFYPNSRLEKKLLKKGFQLIAGLDEAGKGAWAGPIVAAAVILPAKIKIKGVKDSKLLRRPQRQRIFEEILSVAQAFGVGRVEAQEIDQIGISQANQLAMKLALEKLNLQPDYLLIDALNFNFKNLPISAIIDGDYKIRLIAAASIIAKVSRDQMMDDLDQNFPQYGFKQHKGYGTNQHFQMILKYGLSELHRKTWEPMKHFLNGWVGV